MTDEIVKGIVPVPQKDIVLLLEAGYLFMELSKNKEAEEVFQGVAALVPHSEIPHMALGNLYFSMGHFNPANKSHLRALELNPESASVYAAMGETLFFLRKHKEALEALDKAIAIEANGPAGHFAKALKEAYDLGVFS